MLLTVFCPLKPDGWPYHVPVVMYILEYILSGVLCFAVGIMLMFHLWTIIHGETSVESQDNDHYGRIAKSRGEVSLYTFTYRRYPQIDMRVLRRLLSTRTILGKTLHVLVELPSSDSCVRRKLRNLQLFFNVGQGG